MKPARGLLRVKPIETAETLPGGRITLIAETRERMTAWQCECIAVGLPSECDPKRSRAERKCERQHTVLDGRRVHPCSVDVGAWLLVRPRSYIAGPEPERAEWFVHQDDVLAILSED